MAVALLPVVAALAAGVQLAYSSASYAAGIVLSPPTKDEPPPLTPEQRKNIPRVNKRILPQTAMYQKFRKDYSNTTYVEPNPAAKIINTEATLPPSFYDAYSDRISRMTLVVTPSCVYSRLDPNLKVAQYISPRVQYLSSNITAQQCQPADLDILQHRSRARGNLPPTGWQSH